MAPNKTENNHTSSVPASVIQKKIEEYQKRLLSENKLTLRSDLYARIDALEELLRHAENAEI